MNRPALRTPALSLLALGALVLQLPLYAQIKADPGAPGNQRPTILQTANGVTQVNIQTPSAAGVSRNTYSQFDVGSRGAILNNSRTNTQTQIGGMVAANPWIATPARVILNEVNASNPSHLKGPVEVAGQRAEVIIANPSGIQVNGGTFLNASGVTLTTGTPVMNSGNLESFRVQKGMVNVEGLGLDASTADSTRILARAVEVNAGLWARNVTLVTGANDVKALASGADATATKIAGTGAAPAFMLDVAAIGGMYAGHIYLVGTEAGLGVNNRGIVSAQQGNWVLRADGWLVNTGKLQAKGDLSVNTTGAISNTAGGQMVSEGDLSLAASNFNNQGGKVQALGSVGATARTINNIASTIEANGGVTLNATSVLDNTGGTLRAGQNLTVQDVGTTRTLAITNAGGTAQSGANNTLQAKSLTGNGTVQAAGNLAIDLQSDFESNTDLVAGGDASVTTTGTFTNRARLSAGQTATAKAANVINAAVGEIVGRLGTTVIATTSLTNRGLIDGGKTRVNAATLTNTGTGRIYGDHVAIAAATLTNDTETLNSVRADAVIAARERLDIGVGTLTNREHALIFSAGTGANALNIGGALDVNDHAIGSVTTLNNNSATIESLGGLSINATRINNTNEHFSTQVIQKGDVTSATEYSLGAGDVYRGRDLSSHFLPSQVNTFDCEALCLLVTTTGDSSDSWVRYSYTSTPYETVVKDSDPGKILSGSSMNLTAGAILNDKSQILAGSALSVTGTTVDNTTVQGERRWVNSGTATSYWRVRRSGRDGYGSGTSAYNPADTVQAHDFKPGRVDGNVAFTGTGTQVAVRVVAGPGSDVLTLAGGTVSVPAGSLFRQNPAITARYVIESDARFTNYRQWLGSDYMFNALRYDPATVQKRLGDGFYEQKLVREQVAQLTGRRFLDGYANDEAQYRALMDSAVTFAQQWRLVPGIALSADQMARLTSDMVWLVAQEVTLPDGTKTTALAPQVYVRARAGDLAPSGAFLAGQSVNMNLAGDLTNSGTIAGRTVVTLNARNVQNLGEIMGQRVNVAATQDLNNVGGSLIAKDRLNAQAGRDLNVQSSTATSSNATGSRTNISRVAGLYVTGDGGTLLASAGRDLNVVAGVLQSNGSIEARAGNNVNLATVSTAESNSVAWSSANWRKESSTQEVGTQIGSAGTTTIRAGNDLTARAATVNAGGALAASADNNVLIEAGQNTRDVEEAARHKSRGTLSSRTLTTHDKINETQAVGTSLSGDTVTVTAGNNLGVKGSSVISDNATTLTAANNIAIEAAENTTRRDSDRMDKKSGVFSGGGIGITAGTRKLETDQDSRSTTAAASTVGAISGNVRIVAGQTYKQTGSDVLAPAGAIDITAKSVEITEARETSTTTTEQRFKQSGITLAISNPVVSAVQTASAMTEAARNTDSGRMKGLAAANVAFAANNALNAVKTGQGQEFAGKSNQVVTEDAAGNMTSRDATAAERAGGINLSISIGSSKSSSTSTQTSDTGRGSNVAAAGNVDITAKGAGANSDILVRGSEVTAGNNATLKADGDIALQAAQSTASLTGSNSSRSGSIGLSLDLGSGGLGVTASASRGRGNEAGNDTTYTNTQVTAGNTASLQSGANTNLQGAVVKAHTVQANVGGNLNIASLQDTSTYDSRQRSGGGSVTLGPNPGGTFNASTSNIDSTYQSVTETSGIKAGDGGFQVSAGRNTELKGAVIASNEAAVVQGKNSFSTGGTLTTSDIQNKASYSASSTSVGVGTGLTANLLGLAGLGMGLGSDSGSASSTTTAGISGIAGDKTVRSTDAETGIARIFDKEKVQREIDARVKITETFSREAPKAVASFAASQASDLQNQLQVEADPDKRTALQGEIAKWGEGGAYRILLHTLTGALGGGLSGATGVTVSASSANLMNDLQDSIENSLRNVGLDQDAARTVAQSVTTLTAAGIGAAVGGTQGAATAATVDANNRQLHPTEMQRIKQLANGDAQKESRLAAAACALVRCADGVPLDDPSYGFLKAMQDAGTNYAAEKVLLSQQSGWEGRSYGPLFRYTGVDAYLIDPLTQNKAGTRAAGAVQAGLGIAGVAGSGVLCTTGIGCVAGAITGTVSADYAQAGAKQALTGNAATPYGEQVLQSFGLSPQAAAYTYAALGISPTLAEALVLNKAASEAAKYNQLAKASYSEFSARGINAQEGLASPQGQALLAEFRSGNPALSEAAAQRIVVQMLEAGSTLPVAGLAAPGSVLIKVVPKGDGISTFSPYWLAPEQARAIAFMSQEQASQVLGLPAAQAAKMLSGGLDFYAITPKSGSLPKVFVSDISDTAQGAVANPANAQQVLVPNRTLWSDPKPVNPITLR